MSAETFLVLLALSYGLGVLWYELLPGKVAGTPWRVAAFPFVGIWVVETFFSYYSGYGPTFGGIHLFAAVGGSFVAVVVDWLIMDLRHRTAEPSYESPHEVATA